MLPYGGRHHHASVPNSPAIECKGLTVHHRGQLEPALVDIWLKIPRGAAIAVVGANGAGKSTLLKTIAGLLTPSSGTISVLGQERGNCFHRVSYLPQRSEIDWHFPISLKELVLMGRYVHLGWFQSPTKEDYEKAAWAINELNLFNLKNRQIGELSGGQQQRALLARCLIQDSVILLLDEPLNAVDPETVSIIQNVLKHQLKMGKTILMATHDVDRIDNPFDGVLFLHQGREVQPPHAFNYPIKIGKESFA
jgi:ABC-type Mn2+/Zn2+ transport system ATPase subunit